MATSMIGDGAGGGRAATMRERIVQAAIGLLREGGAKKLGQTQVARAAGMPQGHLTYYFPRKRDLMLAVADQALGFLHRTLQAAAPAGSGTSPDRAKAIDRLADAVVDRARTRMLLGLLVEADEDEELRGRMREATGEMRALVSQAMRLPPDSADVTLALGALWGLSLQEFLCPPDAVPEACRREVKRVIELFTSCYEEKFRKAA